jgi:hypothetical protein
VIIPPVRIEDGAPNPVVPALRMIHSRASEAARSAALIARIDRELAPENERLVTARAAQGKNELGDYYVIDWAINALITSNIDPETFVGELGVLKSFERMVD